MPAISVRGLSKSYRVYTHPSQLLLEVMGGGRRHNAFAALTDVSFDMAPGEVVGVMGRNGAGKSTLLRVIAGTLEPTSGALDVRGRVSAILELGSGFHPDYSGRDNVMLGGLCLGLSRTEINAKFDEIVEFAELRAVIDRPFRTYSTGMQARLTFAVATSVDPDVLIIDEALSVGDARFALKSFDRIRDFKARGKAILFVSHSINQVVSICDRAILLEGGKVVADGEANRVGSIYHELLFGHVPRVSGEERDEQEAVAADIEPDPPDLPRPPAPPAPPYYVHLKPAAPEPQWTSALGESARVHRYGDGAVVFTKAAVLTPDGQPVSMLQSGGEYVLRIELEARAPIDDYCFGFLLRDPRGVELYGLDTHKLDRPIIWPALAPGDRLSFGMSFVANLAAGPYFMTLGIARSDEHKYDLRFDALEVVVGPTRDLYTSSMVNLYASFVEGRFSSSKASDGAVGSKAT
jgi:lipopolysaccharide transport system ATP-binding protein